MNDTPKEILQKQFEIIYARPLHQKVAEMFDLTELSRAIILNQLRQKHPEMTEAQLKVERFKIFYKSDFDQETLNRIAVEMEECLNKQTGVGK
jgi:hypothetical protein